MRNPAETIQSELGLDVETLELACRVRLPKGEGVVFCVVIPYGVLEWSADASDPLGELWFDWADYYAVIGETREQLRDFMTTDVLAFITNVLEREIRVVQSAKGRSVEWRRAGSWERPALGGP